MIFQPTISLADYIKTYTLENDITPKTIEQYALAVRLLERFAPDVGIEDLTDDLVNRWLVWLEDGRTKRTVLNYRRSILTLWRSAYQAGRIDVGPLRIKKLKVPESVPEAWSAEQVEQLLKAADSLVGPFRKTFMPRRLWWRAFIMVNWDTALRLGDILALRRKDVLDDGRIMLVQHKTGHAHRCRLRPETIRVIDRLKHPRRTMLPLWGTRDTFYVNFRRLVKAAGLRGSSKWLRRSSATAVEAIQPGAAMHHLGHRTPGLAYRHYIDPKLLDDDRPMPPPITPEGGAAP